MSIFARIPVRGKSDPLSCAGLPGGQNVAVFFISFRDTLQKEFHAKIRLVENRLVGCPGLFERLVRRFR